MMKTATNPKNRRLISGLSILLTLVLVFSAGLIIWLARDNHLDKIQENALNELQEKAGTYDENTIVLYDTSISEATRLAKQLGAKLRISGDGKFATLTLSEGEDIKDVYSNRENRQYIEKMSLDFHVKASEVIDEEYERLPSKPNYWVSDDGYAQQDYLDWLNIGDAWNWTRGEGVTIAVIDTGIDTDHPEFLGRISEYSYNASEDKIVKDYTLGNGSYDWSLIEDEQGHGTAVTGVIAASMNNGGVVGIAPNVNIIVIKAECDENGSFLRTSDLVFGLYYAIERNADVVNMSFGTYGLNPFEEATRLAVDSDIICVAAAGNEGTSALMYPAADENVIGVGALASGSWELAEYSNFGENVDIVAPGSTYTTKMGGGYGTTQGTSLACPTVVGALALYQSRTYNPMFSEIQEILFASSYDLGDLGRDWYYGYGALDISALICEERGKVTFNMLTDELESVEQIFIRNHTLQNLPEPERLYAVFDGWYYDIDCTEELNWYEDEFTSDLTLYAKWVNEDDGVPYTYVELEDGTIEIRSYTGHRRYITMPDTIEGKIVSSIGEEAFKGQSKIREIVLPDGLQRIRRSAFEGCSSLVSIHIPDGVVEIGERAFESAVRLSTISFSSKSSLKTIGNFAFANCSKLEKIELPKTLESVNGSAFLGTISLKNISVQADNKHFRAVDGVLFDRTASTLVAYPAARNAHYNVPSSAINIGAYAFAYSKLDTISLGKAQNIGEYSFMYSGLEEVVIPNSVKNMGESAFEGCAYLKNVTLSNGLSSIPSFAFKNTISLQKIEIPANVTAIGSGAFGSSGIESITFAENSKLTLIADGAFKNTRNLYSVEFPKSLVVIGREAFKCSSLEKIDFEKGSSLQVIGASAFEGNYSLTEITFPKTLRQIGDYAFAKTGLLEASVPAATETLGAGAFAYCNNLENIFVDKSNKVYTSIDGVVYNHDKSEITHYPTGNSRTYYEIDSKVTKIGDAAFEGALKLTNVGLPQNLITVGNKGFCSCENINSYNLPSSLTYIEEYAFAHNYSLGQSIDIPDNVIQISRYAFAYDEKLNYINFSENSKLPRISYAAFANTGLYFFAVPANVSTIAQYAFEGCDDLTNLTFARNSKLESISAYMFLGCDNLYSITFESGSSLKSIQAHGLEGMRNLTSINFGDAELENIDNYAFRFCESLREVNLPESVKEIGRYAFHGCASLSDLALPKSLEFIGTNAFLFTNDVNLYFAADTLPPHLGENWDNGIKGYYIGVTDVIESGDWKYAKLTNGSISIIEYKGNDTQIDLTKLNFGGKITSIGGYAFEGKPIKSVILPETLIEIHQYAFANTDLQTIKLPASLSFIGKYAFYRSAIQSVDVNAGGSLETIEQYAFSKCENLNSFTFSSSLKKLGRYAFANSGLQSVNLENYTPNELPEGAFMGSKLVSVELPDTLTLINHNAFRDCESLTSVKFGKGELQLMSNVFYNTGLSSLYIPENLTYIGEYSFVGLRNLTKFEVAENNPKYTAIDGLLYSKDGRKLIAAPAGRGGEITLPESLEVLGFGAFENSALTRIYFHENSNILTFGYRCFYNSALVEIEIPASVVSFDYYAFAMCQDLKTVTFEEGTQLKGIYEGAFYGCTKLENIEIPASVVEISDFAFYGCRALTKIPVEEGARLKGIYSYAFASSGITELNLPDSLLDIGDYAFKDTKLISATIPDANKKQLILGIGVFEGCNDLVEITLPFIGASFEDMEISWLGYIFGAGDYQANNAYVPASLKTVTITEGITGIYTGAFYNLENLEQVNVPYSVTAIGDYIFYGCPARHEFKQEIIVCNFRYGVEILDRVEQGYFGHGLSGELKLAEGITTIGGAAFLQCYNVESIVIPKTTTIIENNAFDSCYALESISLPDTITSIGQYAFRSCHNLKSITLPKKLTIIEEYMFSGCNALEKIIIPNGITTINSHAFNACKSLKTIVIPESVTNIDSGVFEYCTALESISIPDSVTNLNTEWLFLGCHNLNSVRLPNNITAIDSNAFFDCIKLKNLTIPESVTRIGAHAFYRCDNINEITIPKNITYIGDSAFEACNSLRQITNNSNLAFEIGSQNYGQIAASAEVIYNADGSVQYKEGFEGVTYFTTSEGFLFSVKDGAYTLRGYNGNKDTITLPTSINGEKYSIYRMQGVKNVIIPDVFTKIDDYAFENCVTLESVVIPNSATTIGAYAFASCHSLKEITIPSSVKTIETYAFYDCIELKNLTISEGVKKIGYHTFRDCDSLESVIIPESVEIIDGGAFEGCDRLRTVSILGNIESIGEYAFWYCTSLEEVLIKNNNISTISKYMFAYCSNLKKIVIPEGVTTIDSWAFAYCENLESIIIPESVNAIGDSAFKACAKLESITMPTKLKFIGPQAFADCSGLHSVIIPDSVTTIGPGAFTNTGIKELHIDKNNSEFSFKDGILYNKALTKILWISDDVVDVIVPASVTTVESAFAGNKNVKSVRFEDGSKITAIGEYAFEGCTNLESIMIPDGVTTIELRAFYGCVSLKDIIIPNDVTSIGQEAFSGCSALESIIIPKGVTSIGASAFYECSALESIIIPEGVTVIESNAFANASNLVAVTIPNTVTRIFYGAFQDCSSLKTIDIPNSVNCIDGYAFSGCKNLTSIVIPDGITEIKVMTFYNCDNLCEVSLPDTLTSIGEWAFASCDNLVSITIPKNVKKIEKIAFGDCYSLVRVVNQSELPITVGGEEYGGIAANAKIVYNADGSKQTAEATEGIDYIITEDDYLIKVENNDYTLVAYIGNKDTITLPSHINGKEYSLKLIHGAKNIIVPKEFTEINDYAFSGCDDIESIKLPESITTIGEGAFYSCRNLANIEIPSTVTSIERYAFVDCYTLNSITLPDSVTHLGAGAFQWCIGLESVTISNSLTIIDNQVFLYCSALKNVEIPNSVTNIGHQAFSYCENLENITIPNSVTNIGWQAFSYCENLENITIPDGVTYIDRETLLGTAFYNNPENWINGCLFVGNHLIAVNDTAIECTLPSGVIADGAFDNAFHLRKLTISGDYMFELEDLTNIETLVLTKLPSHRIYEYFEWLPSDVPLTLKNIVIAKDCAINSYDAFAGLNNITIYVEQDKENFINDTSISNWHNGNKVYYGDEWHTVEFLRPDGSVIDSRYYLNSQIIRQPYVENIIEGEKLNKFVGWDTNGDGVADFIPATSVSDIRAVALYSEHRPGEWVEISEPNCTTNGERQLLCLDCGELLDREILSKHGHDSAEIIGTFAPTCTESGYEKHRCINCNEEYHIVTDLPTGHKFGEWYTTAEPTCSSEGTHARKCTICDFIESETISSAGHDYNVEIVKEATCTKEGEKRFTCKDCGDVTTEKTPLAEHKYEKKYASKSFIEWLIERLLNIFFGYEGDEAYYFICTTCNHIQTYEEGVKGSTSASSTCIHQLGDWATIRPASCVEGLSGRVCSLCEELVEARAIDATGVHNIVSHEAKDPTCTEIGWDAYVTCSYCDYTTYAEKAALGHDEVAHEAKSPTCTEIGWDAYVTCSRCDYTTYAEKTALGHDEIAHDAKAPTCTTIGWNAYVTCSRCDYTTYAEKTALGHDEVAHEAKDPTCTEIGWDAYVTCLRCDYTTYEELKALGHDEIAHDAKAPTCTEIGWNAYVTCSRCDYTTYVEIYETGHFYSETITAPTCTENGYITYDCDRCDDFYVSPYADAFGHTWIWVIDKDSTYTEVGYKHQECTVCDAVQSENTEIPIRDHDHNYVVSVTKQPTCTEKGEETYTCSVCGDSYTHDIAALGHDEVAHDAKAPTCTTIGWNAYVTCSRCDYTTYEELKALGHTFVWVTDREPTYTQEGLKHHECTVCGMQKDKNTAIDVIPHEHDYSVSVLKQGNCTEMRVELYTCIVCNDSYTCDIEAFGHTEVIDTAIDPTCTESGLSAGKHCSTCDEILIPQRVLEPKGHEFINNSCLHCGKSNELDAALIVRLKNEIFAIKSTSTREEKLDAINKALASYDSVSDKTLVAKDYEQLKAEIEAYNAEVESANDAFDDAADTMDAVFATSIVLMGVLSGAWITLRKFMFGGNI